MRYLDAAAESPDGPGPRGSVCPSGVGMEADLMLLKQTLGEPRVLISRSALLHNARVIRRAIGDGVRICAILKADAYGHGAAIVADTLCNFSADESAHPAVDAV